MHDILCSTGALIGRPHNGDFRFIDKCIEKLNCDGLEFMLYGQWYDKTDEIRDYLQNLPLPVPVFHAEKRLGDVLSRNAPGDTQDAIARFEINARLASAINSGKIVLHLWGGLDSDRDIAHNIALYRDLRKICDDYGLILCVENIVCNQKDPLTHMRELIGEYPDISFTYDTKMAEFHHQLMDVFAVENEGIFDRVSHMHINDYNGAYMDWANLRTLNIGCGHVDFAGFFENALRRGYRGDFTVEATSYNPEGIVDFDALNNSFAEIRRYISQK